MKRFSFIALLLLQSLLLSISTSAAAVPSSEIKAENCRTIASCTYPGDASFAITNDGSLWAWGSRNYHGSVGNGTKGPVETPVKILSNAVSIKAGSSGAIALCADGSVYTWGTFQYTATKMLENAVDIFIVRGSAGSGNTSDSFFALKADSTLWGWGGNGDGEIGNCKEIGGFVAEPRLIMSDVKTMIDANSSVAAVIKTDNALWGWGDNGKGCLDFGQKGYDDCWDPGYRIQISGVSVDDSDDYKVCYKAPCLIMEDVRDACFIKDSCFVIRPDNTLWGWGDNSDYTLGVDDPSSFLPLTYITDNVLSCPYEYWMRNTAVIKRDHTVWFWGFNWVSGLPCYKTPVCIGTEATSADAVKCGSYRLYKDGSLYEVDSYNYYVEGTHYVEGQYSIDEGSYETETLVMTNVRFPGQRILTPGTFQDVFTDDFYYDAVEWAAANGITDGTDPTHFSSNNTTTRAQVVTFLWRAMGQPEPTGAVNSFTDVKSTDYFYKPVLWAVEQGITDGTGKNTFSPAQTCSNAHILTFLYRAMGEPDGTDGAAWYSAAESWAKAGGLTENTAANSDITGSCSRADAVTFLFRQLGKQ